MEFDSEKRIVQGDINVLDCKKTRIGWIDFIKGIAILELVIYHFGVLPWLISPVPIFFFLSGFFFSDSKPFGVFFKQKAKALMLPFLFFYVLGLFANVVGTHLLWFELGGENLYLFFTLIPIDNEIQNPLGVGAIWFLPCLFEIFILYYAIRRISRNRIVLLNIAILLMIASSILKHFFAMGSLFYLFDTFQFFILFVIGHLFKNIWLKDKMSLWVGILGFLAFLTLYVTDSENWNYVLVFVLNKIQMMGVILFLIVLATRIPDGAINRVVSFYGRNSLTVLGVHLLGMGACTAILPRFLTPGFLYYSVMFFLILVFCTFCICIFNRFCPVLVNSKK